MFGDQANAVGQIKPNNNAPYGNTYNSSWRNHPNFSWKPRAPQYQQSAQPSQQSSSLEQVIVNLSKVVGDFVGDQKAINAQLSQRIDRMDGMHNDLSQKIDNLQYSISRLTNLNTVQEKGRFPSQPHQNPKGIHEVEIHEGESSQVKDVKALITLRSGKKIEKPTSKPHVEEEEETKKGEVMKGKKKDVSEMKEDHDSTVNTNSEKILLKEEMLKKPTSPPFPQALHGKKGIKNASEILEVLRQVKVNIPLLYMIKIGLMQLTFGNMTLELNIFDMSKKQITLEEEEGPEEVCIIDTLVEEHCWSRREEILPLYNKEEGETTEEETPKLNLKPLPVELKYTYLEENNQCPVVISSSLTSHQEKFLLEVLKRCKKAIGWQISYLKGISRLVCTHHIYMEEKVKPIRQPQRRLNPHLQEVVLTEVLKLLQAGIIYPISDSPWVSPTQVVPKNQGLLWFRMKKEKKLLHASLQVGGCIEKGLVLNWEKCHFMVHQGIVLGHIISEKGIEVDKAKVELIAKLPSPTTMKGVRQFLGHAGFYRRFIQDFSKLSRPLCELLAEDAKAPNWQLPFEVMCNASDFAIGAVLGQREDGKPYVIYYASKTLNEAQRNYTTTEKELDKKGVENVVADHLSRLAIAHNSRVLPINDVIRLMDSYALALVQIGNLRIGSSRWGCNYGDACFPNRAMELQSLVLHEFELPKALPLLVQVAPPSFGMLELIHKLIKTCKLATKALFGSNHDDFPEESLMLLEKAPWYAHIANYLVTSEVPSEWKAQDRKHFFAKIHAYYWEEPFLFKYCADQIIRKCVPEEEQQGILSHCHENTCGGHFASQKTAMKVLQSGFTGHRFSKIPTSCVGVVIDAKDSGSLQKETKCP
ncbi:Retrovirus-related Pol polyprotein from transposon opus [Vitis vinifera]|uniref:Retrovirus-related Pol polyprotein from transposon opus n=1 Tax=Vitis vinifera TaxID=29760 RepID=A0A438CVW6_VITVI|nr:Retrovirus-related Pol polyprotein from transposon opus [Vitis vinifera]